MCLFFFILTFITPHTGFVLLVHIVLSCPVFVFFQILVLELNDEAAEQTVEAKVVDLLQGQEGFRWKVMINVGLATAKTNTRLKLKK